MLAEEWRMRSPLNWKSIITVGSVLVLAGCEVFTIGLATAWAVGGLFEFGDLVTYVVMAVFCVLGAVPLLKLAQMAFAVEPMRGRSTLD
jgi:hypothetical protein